MRRSWIDSGKAVSLCLAKYFMEPSTELGHGCQRAVAAHDRSTPPVASRLLHLPSELRMARATPTPLFIGRK